MRRGQEHSVKPSWVNKARNRCVRPNRRDVHNFHAHQADRL